MTALLRLFPQFRALEDELQSCAAARIESDDRVRYWRSRFEIAEEERQRSQIAMEHALKSVANFEALRGGSVSVPFPEAYSPPEPIRNEEGLLRNVGGYRKTAREAQIEQVERTRRSAMRPPEPEVNQ